MVLAPVMFEASIMISPLTSSVLLILIFSIVLALRVCVALSVTKTLASVPLFRGANKLPSGKVKLRFVLLFRLVKAKVIFLLASAVSSKIAPL